MKTSLAVSKSSIFDGRARLALVLACIALTGSALGFQVAIRSLNVYLRKEPVPLRSHFDTLPMSLAGGAWQGERKAKLKKEMVEELGTSLYIDAQFEHAESSASLGAHIAYYTGFIDAVPHVPDRCLVAAGFNLLERPRNLEVPIDRGTWTASHETTYDGERYPMTTVRDPVTGIMNTVHLPAGDLLLRTSVYTHADQPGLRLVAGYLFIANGRATATPEGVKRMAFDTREKHAYYCKVQFHAAYDRSYDLDDFTGQVALLMQPMLPQIMRCLPDWPEIKASELEDAAMTDSK